MNRRRPAAWAWWAICWIAVPTAVAVASLVVWTHTGSAWVGSPFADGTCAADAKTCQVSAVAATVGTWTALTWWLWLTVGVVGTVVLWGRRLNQSLADPSVSSR